MISNLLCQYFLLTELNFLGYVTMLSKELLLLYG